MFKSITVSYLVVPVATPEDVITTEIAPAVSVTVAKDGETGVEPSDYNRV